MSDFSHLTRTINAIPVYIHEALEARGLLDAYHARPAYQQNDYLGWIERARRPETKEKRLNQMLNELEKGDVYMRMKWQPK
jgi:uncharacterized protein YdeI (YjbR/CyaY-like superfamily)